MSGDNIRSINPGSTHNIGSKDHLTQIQHKGDHVDIVDHTLHDQPFHPHIVTHVDKDGNVGTDRGW